MGIGEVTGPMVPLRDLKVEHNGAIVSVISQPDLAPILKERALSEDEETTEFAVPVNWIVTRQPSEAISERGLFASQVTVCKLRDERTIEVVTAAFDLGDS